MYWSNIICSIKKSTKAINAPRTLVIGGGGTLMPALIENHAHLMLMCPSLPAMARVLYTILGHFLTMDSFSHLAHT
jgi:imidazolonepropionase-like amidohydrolase